MPGFIRVSVLEAVDIPETLTGGQIGKDVTAKVTLGPKFYKTQTGVLDGGRIESWNTDFSFPVLNLRDKLMISICDSEDHSVTQTAIEIPSIIQKGLRDEFVSLSKGGLIHLRMSFTLSDEERKKIETMRVAALKSREEAERLNNIVVFQPIHDTSEKESKESVITTPIDVPTSFDRDEPKDLLNAPLDPLSSSKHPNAKSEAVQAPLSVSEPAQKLTFNYAKAIGLHHGLRTTDKCLTLTVPDVTCEINESYRESSVKEGAKVTKKAHSLGASWLDSSSVSACGSRDRDFPCVSLFNPISLEESDSSACNGGKSSEVQSAGNCANEGGEMGSSDVLLELPSSRFGTVSLVEKPTYSGPLLQNLMNSLQDWTVDKNPDVKIVRKRAGNLGFAGSSRASKQDPVFVDVSPDIRNVASSMVISASKATPQHSSFFSGLSPGGRNSAYRLHLFRGGPFEKECPPTTLRIFCETLNNCASWSGQRLSSAWELLQATPSFVLSIDS